MRTGVAGFGYFGDRPVACARRFTPARSFAQLIALVRAAEGVLTRCGYNSVEDRIHVLRGLYYGTNWSNDYRVERSPVRNAAFQLYTASSAPADPRSCLTCGLFEALQRSSDVRDGGRSVDFGHVMIALDARRNSISRTSNIPTQGGPGLAICTWLGDLGGGAGMLAWRRVANPRTSVMSVFQGTDFGGSINLEGDVAGHLVAAPSGVLTAPPALAFGPGHGIADALELYLGSRRPTAAWNQRATSFARMFGGMVGTVLMNPAQMVNLFADMIEEFGCWYLLNRLRQKNSLSASTVVNATMYLPGAAREVAEVFVTALAQTIASPSRPIAARGTGPAPSGPRTPSGVCRAAAIAALGVQATQRVYQGVRSVVEEGLRRAEEGVRRLNPF
jgi:hypothetical protein